MQESIKKKELFFINLLNNLAKNEWSANLIKETEKLSNFPENYHRLLFPNDLAQLALEFEEWLDAKLLVELTKITRPEKIREQIALGLTTRIIDLVPKNVILQLNSFFLLPNNIPAGSKAAFASCNSIWRYAGDQATDFNFYSKRGLLLSVYLSARTYYLADNSENHQQTRIFIKKSLDNIISLASFKKYLRLPKAEDIPVLRLFS